MRGTLFVGNDVFSWCGIIPAHAGNTFPVFARRVHRRDHPRACGEHKITAGGASMEAGSSPRMRGTLSRAVNRVYGGGIIPAHAGNTLTSSSTVSVCWDHPRACGEHSIVGMSGVRARGSSPRMRGTLNQATGLDTMTGIIPAHAGNTIRNLTFYYALGDHPRACGEHSDVAIISGTLMGSSPRMRGTPFIFSPPSDENGIIPAHAGNTGTSKRSGNAYGDHPRACGEHGFGYDDFAAIPGSSPRMRGTLMNVNFADFIGGIIPAHAGNTHRKRL